MRSFLLAAVLATVAVPAAQAQIGFTPTVGYDFDYEAATVGLGFEFGLTPGILPFAVGVRPSVEYIFADENVDAIRFNGDLIGRFSAPGLPVAPYGKAGVTVEHVSVDDVDASNTEVGLNLGAGVEVNRFAVEGTLGIGDISSGRITVGYRF